MRRVLVTLGFLGAVAFAVLVPGDAVAGHLDYCAANTGNSRHVDASPDYHAWGTTRCYISDGGPDVIDMMTNTVFWEHYDWANYPYHRGWVSGGLYTSSGCGMFCYGDDGKVEYGTQAHHNVPFPSYMMLICRRANTIHVVWEHVPNRRYYYSQKAGICA